MSTISPTRFQAGYSVADIATDFSAPPDEVEDVVRLATRTAAWAMRQGRRVRLPAAMPRLL